MINDEFYTLPPSEFDDRTFTVFALCYPMNKTAKLLNHHFIYIPRLKLEIHPGEYDGGTHRTISKDCPPTPRAHVYNKYECCAACINSLLITSHSIADAWYWYPLVNCETLTSTLMGDSSISIQGVLVLSGVLLVLSGITFYVYIAVVIFILTFIYNRWLYYKHAINQSCIHVRLKTRGAD